MGYSLKISSGYPNVIRKSTTTQSPHPHENTNRDPVNIGYGYLIYITLGHCAIIFWGYTFLLNSDNEDKFKHFFLF